ncbi:MAG: glycosyltransferase family 4 protein [Gemmatimonadaceae bacterium]
MRRLKVAIGVDDLFGPVPGGGGQGRVVVSLLRELAEWDTETEYTLYSARAIGTLPPVLASLPPHMRLVQLPVRKPQLTYLGWHTLRRPRLERWIGAHDVVHATSPNVVPACGDARLVLTVHDLVWSRFPEGLTFWGRFFHRTGLTIAAREAAAIAADSEATRADVFERMGDDLDRSIVHCIHLGTDFVAVKDASRIAAVQATLGITGDYVLAIGTREPRKNHRRLLEAFHALPNELRARTQLVVVGAAGWGVEGGWLDSTDRVVWTGYLPDEDMRALLSGATAFAYPSLFEGFGLPILEAMACDVPVITSNTSSMPEVAGDAALLVEPTNVPSITAALSRLLGDDALRRSLVARGRIQRARFSNRRMAEQYRDLYEQVARGAAARRPANV